MYVSLLCILRIQSPRLLEQSTIGHVCQTSLHPTDSMSKTKNSLQSDMYVSLLCTLRIHPFPLTKSVSLSPPTRSVSHLYFSSYSHKVGRITTTQQHEHASTGTVRPAVNQSHRCHSFGQTSNSTRVHTATTIHVKITNGMDPLITIV